MLLLFFVCANAHADTLVLLSGAHIYGIYLGGDSRTIRFETADHINSYPLAEVEAVRFVSTAPGAAAHVAPPSKIPASTIAANTPIIVRLIDPISSKTASAAAIYRASIDAPVYGAARMVIPMYSSAVVQLVDRQTAGRLTGHAALTLALIKIVVGETTYQVETIDIVEASANRGAHSGGIIGAATGLGALVGAIAGAGKGAAIGAGSGAAAGTAVAVLRPGQEINLPSETRLTFRLATPMKEGNGHE
jgi:hypothetical protein